jgi:hypothetical protein
MKMVVMAMSEEKMTIFGLVSAISKEMVRFLEDAMNAHKKHLNERADTDMMYEGKYTLADFKRTDILSLRREKR